jgi:hypothetical protein
VESRDELRLLDQAGLQRQQAEKEMAVGSHGNPPANLGRGSAPATIVWRPAHDRMNASIL